MSRLPEEVSARVQNEIGLSRVVNNPAKRTEFMQRANEHCQVCSDQRDASQACAVLGLLFGVATTCALLLRLMHQMQHSGFLKTSYNRMSEARAKLCAAIIGAVTACFLVGSFAAPALCSAAIRRRTEFTREITSYWDPDYAVGAASARSLVHVEVDTALGAPLLLAIFGTVLHLLALALNVHVRSIREGTSTDQFVELEEENSEAQTQTQTVPKNNKKSLTIVIGRVDTETDTTIVAS